MKTSLFIALLYGAALFIGAARPGLAQGNPTPTPVKTPISTGGEVGKSAPSIHVFGHVMNGTAGAKIPGSLRLTLTVSGIDESQAMSGGVRRILTRDTDMAADGTYSFDNVAGQLGYTYAISARYAGGLQTSKAVILTNAKGDLEVPFTIYEATADPSVVRVTRVQIALDFTAHPGSVQIRWSYDFVVSGDRLFLSATRNTQGDPVSVSLPLPQTAQYTLFSGDN